MKYSFVRLLITLMCTFLFVVGCGVYRSNVEFDQSFDEIENAILVENYNPNFPMPQIPKSVEGGKQRAIYLSKHYWENFPFNDVALIDSAEVTEQAFVDYIHVLNFIPFKDARKSIKYLFVLAQENKAMYAHFASLFEKYFYTADSPYCNEELYIPVLETILKFNILDADDYEKYEFQEEMIHKNRVGSKANDFVYTFKEGDWKRMHSIKSNYLILFFSSPNCSTCLSMANEIKDSEVLSKVCSLNSFSRTMLSVLHIYPGANIPLWQNSLSEMPQKNWIHAYDKNRVLTYKRVYNLKKLPTIYLLDKNKRIILKETSLEEIESYFLSKS